MKKNLLLFIGLFSWMLLLHAQQQNRGFQTEDVFRTKSVSEVAISPDKNFISYTLNVPRPFDHQPGSDYRELYIYGIATGKSQPFITGNRTVFSLGWSPDGAKVIFRTVTSQVPGMQVYAMDMKGGEAYPLTKHPTPVIQYAFLDANTLVITAEEPESEDRKAFRNKGYDIEVFEEETNHINLYKIDLTTGKTTQLTEGVTVFDFAVSPDGKQIAAAIAPMNLVDYDYMFRRIHMVEVSNGKTTLLVDNPGKLGKMVFSNDGQHLAFLSASHVHDAVVGSLFVVNINKPESFDKLRQYTADLRASVIDVAWKDAGTLLFATEEGTEIVLSEQKLTDKQRTVILVPGKAVFYRFSFLQGMLAFAGNTPEHPSELFTGDLRKRTFTKATNHNPWLSEITLAKQEKVSYIARDNLDIEGVLLYPLNYVKGQRYPLIVYIHGGPEAANQNGWITGYGTWGQVAAARGYFLFLPNYRAGSGRGVDFTMQGFGDLAGKEYDDVIDGIDYLINQGLVDKGRVGIGGGSYGGYFAAWSATKHTDRFAASVVFVGVSNQLSKRNTTDIPQEDYLVHWGFWNHEDYEKVYNVSPVKYAHLSKTPTLILHGKEDPRIPPSQGLELYRAMKLHSEAPVRLIYYPGEGHGNRKNINRLDYLVRTMEWFDHYLLGEKKTDLPAKYHRALP